MGAQEGDSGGGGGVGGGGGGGPGTPGNPLEMVSLLEKAKFYTSLCLGTTAIVSVFAFLFLIPFVVDPAISTILSDYEPEPVTCVTVDHVYAEGLRNCSWSSCREGCTTAALKCHQIVVNYTRTPYAVYALLNASERHRVPWDVGDTRFYINTEGCGYPPRVNCSAFAREYGHPRGHGQVPGQGHDHHPFPCYYSRTYPSMVVARYSWDDNLRHLVLSLVVPNVLFAVSIGVLSYWYCPGCHRVCNRRAYVEKENEEEDDFYEEEEY